MHSTFLYKKSNRKDISSTPLPTYAEERALTNEIKIKLKNNLVYQPVLKLKTQTSAKNQGKQNSYVIRSYANDDQRNEKN